MKKITISIALLASVLALKAQDTSCTYFNGKEVCDENNEPYFIYHQWDRTVMADTIRQNHKNTLSFVIQKKYNP